MQRNWRGGLVIERKRNQQLVLELPHGGQVVVSVVRFGRGRMKLHVQAPDDVRIRRGEIGRLEPRMDADARGESTPPPAAHAAADYRLQAAG